MSKRLKSDQRNWQNQGHDGKKNGMKEFERARWRCRRGLLELDIVLQRFMDQYYTQLDESGLEQFERLLALPDNDLWDLITARQANTDDQWQQVLELLQKS